MNQKSVIKLVSANIEMNKHLGAVSELLKREKPDIVCLQEVLERDLPYFEQLLGMKGKHIPMATLESPSFENAIRGLPFGIAMFSRFPTVYKVDYYSGNPNSLPACIEGDEGNKLLLRGAFSVFGKAFTIGVTHFTWTPDGEADEAQRRDLSELFSILKQSPDIVFCGDFNAPRGREIWQEIAKQYTDNLPLHYTSSIDPILHRAKGLQVMVDGLFSTPAYTVSDVRLVEGISDHTAVVVLIERV